eukprot:maker-scaffold1061_size65987-snap-gene-0.8 protein:Tk06303 transcript:maker-scaffold1061_size65987-snap-gene-0.8-mRNA-1 annotation:"conserved hypothetical protein"
MSQTARGTPLARFSSPPTSLRLASNTQQEFQTFCWCASLEARHCLSCEPVQSPQPHFVSRLQMVSPEVRCVVFSLFNVVTFDNAQCTSNDVTNGEARLGTCFTTSECVARNGQLRGTCAAGFGTCCVFVVQATGGQVNQNCTYLLDPTVDRANAGDARTIMYTVNRINSNICSLRLDLDTFNIQGPAVTTVTSLGPCVDQFTIQSKTGLTTICGQNSGEHTPLATTQDRNPARRSQPAPPTFDHILHAEADQLDAFEERVDDFEGFCEIYLDHEAPPLVQVITSMAQWKRLVRLALGKPTLLLTP